MVFDGHILWVEICSFEVGFIFFILVFINPISGIIIYQSSKFSFSCVSLVESVPREIDEIRLSPLHQCARETMHYSLVNNEKTHLCHQVKT